MKLAIIGKYGQLAQAARAYSEIKKIDSISFSRDDFPMQKQLCFDALESFKPTHILAASAYTAVDQAESEKGLCLAINTFSIGALSSWCIRNNVKLVYPSTDYVFDGFIGEYKFSDQVNPINFYGKSKMLGEIEVARVPNFIIARTSWLYGVGFNHFPAKIIQAARKLKELYVVDDQIGSPTYVFDFAQRLIDLMQGEFNGVVHISSRGTASWFDFACKLLELKSIDVKVNPISTKSLALPAKRPKRSILLEERWNNLGFKEMSYWEDSLRDLYLQYNY